MSPRSTALLIGVGGFVVGALICIGVFLAADVSLALLPGPLIAIGIAANLAYKSALRDASEG